MDGIDAVRKLLGLCKAVLVTNKSISLAVFSGVIAAGGFQIDRKFRTGFRGFQLGFAVVRVLNQSDAAFDDLLIHIVGRRIVFHGIELGFCTHMVGGFVQQIPLRRADFPDAPVIITHIVCRDKLAVGIRGIGVNELVAFVNAIGGTGKVSIALGCSGFPVALGHSGVPLFQHIGNALFGDSVPLYRRRLTFGNHITDRGVHFFQHIAGADQNIFEIRLAAAVGHSIFIHSNTGE